MTIEFFRLGIYYIEIVAVFTAIITYRYYRNTPNKYFLFYLLFVVIVETFNKVTVYYRYNYDGTIITFLKKILPESLLEVNLWIGNIYLITIFLIYILYYFKLSKNLFNKKMLLVLGFVFILCASTDVVINIDSFNTHILSIVNISGSIIFLIATIIYLYEVFNSNEILFFHKTLNFWIIFGTLIFHLGTTPIFLFGESFNFSHVAYNYILTILNYILYLSFIIGFIMNARQSIKKMKGNE